MLICFLNLENLGIDALPHLNEINTSKVIGKNGFEHKDGSSFAYLTLLNDIMTVRIACLSALHLIKCPYKHSIQQFEVRYPKDVILPPN